MLAVLGGIGMFVVVGEVIMPIGKLRKKPLFLASCHTIVNATVFDSCAWILHNLG